MSPNESQMGPSSERPTSNPDGPSVVDEIPTNSDNNNRDDNIGNDGPLPDTATNDQKEKEEDEIHSKKELNGEDEKEEEEEDEIKCYICWETDATDEINNPIRRDCGCKGSSGWVHLQCLLESAETKARESMLDPLVRPWTKCPFCVQPYQDPTQTFLQEKMIYDLPRLQQRLLSSGKAALQMWANIFLVFAVVWCAHVFFFSRPLAYALVKSEFVILPKLVALWNESSLVPQLLVGCIGSVLLLKILNDYQAPVGRFLVRWILQMSLGKIVVAATYWNELHTLGYSELAMEVAGPLLVLAAGAYHYRRDLRDDHIQMRQQSFLECLSQFAFGCIVGALFGVLAVTSIARFLDAYQEELYYETMASASQTTSLVERVMSDAKLARLQEDVESMFLLWEILWSDEDMDGAVTLGQVPAMEEKPFREDYWYCCAW